MVTRIDLFDGPSWDEPGFWDDQPRRVSRLKMAAEALGSLLLGLAVPMSFAAGLIAITDWVNWEWNQIVAGLGHLFGG